MWPPCVPLGGADLGLQNKAAAGRERELQRAEPPQDTAFAVLRGEEGPEGGVGAAAFLSSGKTELFFVSVVRRLLSLTRGVALHWRRASARGQPSPRRREQGRGGLWEHRRDAEFAARETASGPSDFGINARSMPDVECEANRTLLLEEVPADTPVTAARPRASFFRLKNSK